MLPKEVNWWHGRCVFTLKLIQESRLCVWNKLQIGASMIIFYEVRIINDSTESTECSRDHKCTDILSSDGEQIHNQCIKFTTQARSNCPSFSSLDPANTEGPEMTWTHYWVKSLKGLQVSEFVGSHGRSWIFLDHNLRELAPWAGQLRWI